MTKVRKQKRKKRFRYGNKRKLKHKVIKGSSTSCGQIRKEWEQNKSAIQNMAEMGLVYDVNKALKIPSGKDSLQETAKSAKSSKRKRRNKLTTSKARVVEKLEEDACTPRVSGFRLPEGQVTWLSYLITKYGEDFKAMARDSKNHYQDTWKQIRAKINTFKKIPDQYNKFLNSQENSSMDTSS